MTLSIILAVVGVILVLMLWFIFSSLFVVVQAQGMVIERFGRFDRVLDSGIHFLWPIIDSPRPFTWRKTYIDSNSRMQTTDTVEYRIDLRECIYNFPIQEVYTRDTILLDVNSIMYYRIFDIKKAVYEVDDLNTAISNVAQTQLKEVFGNMTFTEALASQATINNYMKDAFGERFSQWGVKVERMELLDMTPKAGTTISSAMKRQMIAERTRRAAFITAEGQKSAMRLISEGTKIEKYNTGVAEQEATRKISEGQAGARVELARAESKSLDIIAAAFAADGASQTEYMIAQEYMEMLTQVASYAQKKTIYLPYVARGISGMIRDLPQIFGRKVNKTTTTNRRLVSGNQQQNFDDLN